MMVKRVKHPSGAEILFDSKWHKYHLNSVALISVSKLLDKYFPFDEKRILGLVSRKTGESQDQIKRSWTRQALLGKNIHEFIECRLLDKPPPLFTKLLEKRMARAAITLTQDSTGPSILPVESPLYESLLHGEEHLYMPVAERAVEAIKREYDIIAVEQVIASHNWHIGGTVDFVGRNKSTNRILIGDWKTSGSVASNFRFGHFETACGGCLRHLPNTKAYRYALQIMAYGEILKHENYFPLGFFDTALLNSLERQQQLSEISKHKSINSHEEEVVADDLKKEDDANNDDNNNNNKDGKSKGKKTKMKEKKDVTTSKPKKKRGKKNKKTSITENDTNNDDDKTTNGTTEGKTTSHSSLVNIDYYHHNITDKLEYGIVQMEKDDGGGVVVNFKKITQQSVLSPDYPEKTFVQLLADVLDGK